MKTSEKQFGLAVGP